MLVLLVDDHALMREGMALFMRHRFAGVQLCEAGSLAEAGQRLAEFPAIELILLDLNLPDSQGPSSVLRLRLLAPETPIVVLSADLARQSIEAAIQAGAHGYIPKTARGGDIELALRRVLEGQVHLPAELLQVPGQLPLTPDPSAQCLGASALSPGGMPRLAKVNMVAVRAVAQDLGLAPRQVDVLRYLLEGDSNKAIARQLDLAESTVKTHTMAIFRKLDVCSRAEAMVWAARRGLYQQPGDDDLAEELAA
ncbi:MAG: hypothetical protein RL722_1691 [Pseudomonadota bacterium]|jgi:DNA-binding NarL/FixJ family response regulator